MSIKVTSVSYPEQNLDPFDWFYTRFVSTKKVSSDTGFVRFVERLHQIDIENGKEDNN